MTLREKERYVLSQEKIWNKEKEILEREYKIKAERKSLKEKFKEKKDKIANSKLLVWFLFINCTIIELFTIWVISRELNLAAEGILAPDLSPLMALITTVVAEVIGFGIYALKSTKENTEGGIVFETAMREFEKTNEDNSCG
jgi:predicted nuclease with TOPRIM domain